MNSGKVWIVTRGYVGDYNSYGVDSVFADKTLAEAYAAPLGDAHVEEHDVEAVLPESSQFIYCTAGVRADGSVRAVPYENIRHCWGPPSDPCGVSTQTCFPYNDGSDGAWINLTVQGSDVEQVRRVFFEQLAETRANAALLIEQAHAERIERREETQ